MGKNDLDTFDSDDSDSSSDEEIVVKVSGPRNQVGEYEGFDEVDEDDPVAKQMQTLISLKLSLGIDNDKEFLEEHERKKKEKERIAKMSPEERIRFESEQASSFFSDVAKKVFVDQSKKKESIAWEKPEWAKKTKLRTTAAGEAVKKGVDLQGPITMATQMKHTGDSPKQIPKLVPLAGPAKKEIGWEKPEWAKKTKLKSSSTGEAIKKGADLQAPITQAPQLKKRAETVEEPKPKLRHKEVPVGQKKEIGWEKPEWAQKPKLRSTAAGEKVKKGGDLQGPITQAPHVKGDKTEVDEATKAEVLAFLKKGAVKKAVLKKPTEEKPPVDEATKAEVLAFLKNSKKAKAKTETAE
eukprot:scaffold2992_cov214-Amphora_coffeaeformis.AAC.32